MEEERQKKEISFTEGSVFQSLIRFVLPVFGALFLQATYGSVDLFILVRFGDATNISAVGTSSEFIQIITFIITSLAMGTTVVIGQHIGEKKQKEAGNAIGATIYIFVTVGIVLTILLELLAGNIVSMLQIPLESAEKAVTYIRICSCGIMVIIAYNVISSIFLGVGNAKLPFLFGGISCVINFIGDLLFVAVLKWDVVGAAAATVLAQLVSVIVSLFVIRKKRLPILFTKDQLKCNKKELSRILIVGVPIAIQETAVQVSFFLIDLVIIDMGLMPLSGYEVAKKIVSIIMLVPFSMMQSVSAFVAQNVGAGKMERAWKGFLTAMIIGCSAGAFMFAACFFRGSVLSSVATINEEVISQSAEYLKGFSIDCILTCILFSSIGYFNGVGRSLPVMIQGVTSAMLIRIPVVLYMSKLTNSSLVLIGLSAPITTIYGIAFFAIWFELFRKQINKPAI